jgi:hypothetical protein
VCAAAVDVHPRESSIICLYDSSRSVSVESTWATRVAIHYDRRRVYIRKFGVFERRQPEPSTTTGDPALLNPAEILLKYAEISVCFVYDVYREVQALRIDLPCCKRAALNTPNVHVIFSSG